MNLLLLYHLINDFFKFKFNISECMAVLSDKAMDKNLSYHTPALHTNAGTLFYTHSVISDSFWLEGGGFS